IPGVGVIGLSFFEISQRPLKIGFALGDGRLGPSDAGDLFARVETGKNLAFCHAIAHVGPKVDEDAGRLEPDLGRDARLDGAETEYLNGYVPLDPRDLDLDWS